MEIEERVKNCLKIKGVKYQELAAKTGIAEGKWAKVLNGHNKLKWEEIDAICNLFPEYEYWITRGKTAPEIGQISPDIDETRASYQKQG